MYLYNWKIRPLAIGHKAMGHKAAFCNNPDLPVTMLKNIGDCGFLYLKVKLYCFQGSIQLRVV